MKTLKAAIAAARNPRTALHRACSQLSGLPAGDWAETRQAVAAIRAELPSRGQRTYDEADLIAQVFVEVGATSRFAGRWQFVAA